MLPKNLFCVFLVYDQSTHFITVLDLVIPKRLKKKMIKIGRLPYSDFIKLLQGSKFVITDGGSNQEELYYMGKPCLLLRNYTERIEGLSQNVVLSRNNKSTIRKFIKNYYTYVQAPVKTSVRPSAIIVDCLMHQQT